MRIVIICHPLTQSRSIVFEKKLTDLNINNYNSERVTSDKNLKKLFTLLNRIHLVQEVSIEKYTLNIKMVDGFQDFEKDWQHIQYEAISYVYAYLNMDYNTFDAAKVIFDDRRFEKAFKTIKIPHDFETHRAAWRGAILDKVNSYTETPDPDGRCIYWKNELEKFDAAFDTLLALKLPTDA